MKFLVLPLIALLLLGAGADQRAAPRHPAPDHSAPAQYEYQYAVQDSYSGVDFDANEQRNDYSTQGQYRVQLPDGRTQIVTYTVSDAYSGYVADVKYEGEARFDEPKAHRPQQQQKGSGGYAN